MSKLDYVTIAIVAICIFAIVFLVYKMTGLFNSDKSAVQIETVSDSVEVEDDGTYDYEIDENVDSTGASGNATSDGSNPGSASENNDDVQSASEAPSEDGAAKPSSTKPTTGTNKPSAPKPAATADDEAATPLTAAEGKYMVIGGSFTQKASAQGQVDKLHKKGYDNARVEIFDRGKYAVVMVDRFNNMADAERLVKNLATDGFKSYVKVKQAE